MTSNPDSDHRNQPEKLQRSGATNEVKFLHLSSCSSAFLLSKTRKSLRKSSSEVAFYRSMDEWIDTSLARLDSFQFYLKPSNRRLPRSLWPKIVLLCHHGAAFSVISKNYSLETVFAEYQTRRFNMSLR